MARHGTLVLIGLGILIMTINIVKYFFFYRQLTRLEIKKQRSSILMLRCYILLLCFFLAGYAAVELSILFGLPFSNDLLIGFIFLFGSIFVYIGIVIQSRLTSRIEKSNLMTIKALISAVEARDKNLTGHSMHVSRLSLLIYRHMSKPFQRSLDQTALEYAALLHDIGKLGVPEQVLNKSDSLDASDWTAIRKHPEVGYRILSTVESYHEIAQWVLYHHERMDGSGYLGLPGEQIPLASRIIAVADTFSALTMDRSYRTRRDYTQAAAIMRECAGTQLDTDLVALLLSIPQEEVEACQPKQEEAGLLTYESDGVPPPVVQAHGAR